MAKLNSSTPTVINTELVPLDESFYIEKEGSTEQWFYDNTSQFAPDRSITPLILIPRISVFDKDLKTTYTPSFMNTRWYVNDYDSTQGEYVEKEITNVSGVNDSDYYVISGYNLIVRKNVSYQRSITIRCVATYIDPRDNGINSTLQETVLLTCNRDSKIVFPEVAITSPSGRTFNPLLDYKTENGKKVQDSIFTFDAVVTNSPEAGKVQDIVKYRASWAGTEEFYAPDNVDTAEPIVDIRYPDGTTRTEQSFMYRRTDNGNNIDVEGIAYLMKIKGNTDIRNGKIIPVMISGIRTTGVNQFNEVWEDGLIDPTTGLDTDSERHVRSGFIRVLPSTQYRTKSYTFPSEIVFMYQYDSDKNFITTNSQRNITTRQNCAYLRLRTLKGRQYDTMLSFVTDDEPDFDGIDKRDTSIPITSVSGKNGSGDSVIVFPDGLKKAGTVYDEIKVENGSVKAIKRVGSVDLGTLNYTHDDKAFYARNQSSISNIKGSTTNLVCAKYSTVYVDGIHEGTNYPSSLVNHGGAFGVATDNAPSIWLSDGGVTDATAFKKSLSGVMLYYELETPVEYNVDYVQSPFLFEWFGMRGAQEVEAETFPWYVSGQHTSKLTVDAMWAEKINVVLRAKTASGFFSPSKSYASLNWRVPDIDVSVSSQNGGAVRSNSSTMQFETICNANGTIIDDSVKNEHLRFNWIIRKSNSSVQKEMGFGLTKIIKARELKNVIGNNNSLGSTLVYTDTYLLGAWVPDNGETSTVSNLVSDMFHVWDSSDWGASIAESQSQLYFENNIGRRVQSGETIYGNRDLIALQYANLGESCVKIIINATPSSWIYLWINDNHTEGTKPPEPLIKQVGVNGKAVFDVSSYEFVHVNVIKLGDNSIASDVTSVEVVKSIYKAPETTKNGINYVRKIIY